MYNSASPCCLIQAIKHTFAPIEHRKITKFTNMIYSKKCIKVTYVLIFIYLFIYLFFFFLGGFTAHLLHFVYLSRHSHISIEISIFPMWRYAIKHSSVYMYDGRNPHIKSNILLSVYSWARSQHFLQDWMCAQGSTCAFESHALGRPIIQGFYRQTATTLICLCGCAGWSESSLGARAIL